jgi:hypothetical protein
MDAYLQDSLRWGHLIAIGEDLGAEAVRIDGVAVERIDHFPVFWAPNRAVARRLKKEGFRYSRRWRARHTYVPGEFLAAGWSW